MPRFIAGKRPLRPLGLDQDPVRTRTPGSPVSAVRSGRPSPADVLALHRVVGNRAFGRMMHEASGRRTTLPVRLRVGTEALSGVPMNDVTVHHDSPEPAVVGALAFTRGNVIHLAPGQERHLPHEAWHVAQQRQRRVRPSGQVQGMALNDDVALEREADDLGRQAALGGHAFGGQALGSRPMPVSSRAPQPAAPTGQPPPIQRTITTKDGLFSVSTEQELKALILKLTEDASEYEGLVRWFLAFCYDVDWVFRDYNAIIGTVIQLESEWDAELKELGVTDKELPAAHTMYNLLGKASPTVDEAILHKLVYPSIKANYVNSRGGGQRRTQELGLVYNPVVEGKNIHTMPLNFSWLVALAHHNIAVRIIVPVTERVLIREKAHGKATSLSDVRAGLELAPLSATAREILGLLATGLYELNASRSSDVEKVLTPTLKSRLAFPKDVNIAETMPLSELVKILASHQITIRDESVALDLEKISKLEETARNNEDAKKLAEANKTVVRTPKMEAKLQKLLRKDKT